MKLRFCILFLVMGMCLGPPLHGILHAAEKETVAGSEQTMLMFVGEDLDVLTIASRREESAWQAPAVADSISRRELMTRGVTALSQALDMLPGFYMAQKEEGTEPYLRGIPQSVLFLYETVPLGADLSKSIHPLDYDLSLAPVKRVEVVRGPGSVLWGPDAFAGVVNVVPMSGKDLQGVETGAGYRSSGSIGGFFVNVGHDGGAWDGFFSLSGRRGEEDDTRIDIVRFWDEGNGPVPPGDRYGEAYPSRSGYIETVGRLHFGDWLSLSGRFSDARRHYAVAGSEDGYTWGEMENNRSGYLKLEARKVLDPFSAFRFTGSFSSLDSRHDIIDLALDQRERTWYGELIYDRSFQAGRGLLTGGISYRRKEIRGAPLWDGYLPDFLGPDNESFLPSISEEDYNTTLRSVFGQYNQKIREMSVFLGLRYDDHDTYQDHLSYNLGTVWSPYRNWVLKLLYGSAYRTPFARQLSTEKHPELENTRSLSAEISWRPSDRAGTRVCGFLNKIANHVMEDPFAGLSRPNSQTIKGLELEGHVSPFKPLDLRANLTWIANRGPDEIYHYNDYSFLGLDGTIIRHFTDKHYPYDSGPDLLANIMGTYRITDRADLFLRGRYVSSPRLIFPRGEDFRKSGGGWLWDAALDFRDLGVKGLELGISFKNLADRKYKVPGTYSTIDGEGRSIEVTLKKRW